MGVHWLLLQTFSHVAGILVKVSRCESFRGWILEGGTENPSSFPLVRKELCDRKTKDFKPVLVLLKASYAPVRGRKMFLRGGGGGEGIGEIKEKQWR